MLAGAGWLALTLGARADMITQDQSYSGLTDWTQNLTFSQFNPQLGVLNSVTITETANVLLTSSILNTSAGTSSFSISDDFTLGSTVPSAAPLALAATLNQAFTIPTGNTVGRTSTGATSQGETLTSALSAWEGQGAVVLAADANDEFSYRITGGNNSVNLTSTAGLDATVTYNYTPVPDGPLPLWASLSGLGLVFWCAAGRRKGVPTLG